MFTSYYDFSPHANAEAIRPNPVFGCGKAQQTHELPRVPTSAAMRTVQGRIFDDKLDVPRLHRVLAITPSVGVQVVPSGFPEDERTDGRRDDGDWTTRKSNL